MTMSDKLKKIDVFGITLNNDSGNLSIERQALPPRAPGEDYGCDPVGDGTFRMVPSGDVVDAAERKRRLARFERQ